MANTCREHELWIYIKPVPQAKYGRMVYELLCDHYLGPNNVGNMVSSTETKLASTLYNSEKKIFTWETYVRIHSEQHAVLNGLEEYVYSRIDESYKVRIMMKGSKKTELDVCKANIMAIQTLCENFTAMMELQLTFTKQMKADNTHMNVSEVNYSKTWQGDRHSPTKRGSSGISDGDMADRFYEKHEYYTLISEQKNNNLCLKRIKHGNVGNSQGGGGHRGKGGVVRSAMK
jgi:hypothetical protein